MATLTGGIGKGSKWLLDKIVGALAATGVNPNFLTFLGLVVNFAAAATFAVGHFFTGALIILFAGFLDMLDGQVARRQNRVTAFGAFYDSTLDRYADMALYMGVLLGQRPHAVRRPRGGGYRRFGDGELRARSSGVADPLVQSWIHGAARALSAADYRRPFQSHGRSVVGNRGSFDHHGDSSHRVHLAGNSGGTNAAGHPAQSLVARTASYSAMRTITCTELLRAV
jgi:hypothetical protein